MALAQDRQICCALQRPLGSGRARFVVANLPHHLFLHPLARQAGALCRAIARLPHKTHMRKLDP